MLGAFTRLTQGVLATLGQDAFLRGTVPCRVNIEHGVQVVGSDDNVVVERSIATIANDVQPREGDTLSHPEGTFKLDTLFQNNGYTSRYTLIKLP